jgi:hypothetical protein
MELFYAMMHTGTNGYGRTGADGRTKPLPRGGGRKKGYREGEGAGRKIKRKVTPRLVRISIAGREGPP